MALIRRGWVSRTSAVQLSFSSSVSPPSSSPPPSRVSLNFQSEKKSCCRRMICRVMVQDTVQGIPSVYAREMERLSAKESLILAFNDAGGFEALVTGKIDVNERITTLERLNPTPRPTTPSVVSEVKLYVMTLVKVIEHLVDVRHGNATDDLARKCFVSLMEASQRKSF